MPWTCAAASQLSTTAKWMNCGINTISICPNILYVWTCEFEGLRGGWGGWEWECILQWWVTFILFQCLYSCLHILLKGEVNFTIILFPHRQPNTTDWCFVVPVDWLIRITESSEHSSHLSHRAFWVPPGACRPGCSQKSGWCPGRGRCWHRLQTNRQARAGVIVWLGSVGKWRPKVWHRKVKLKLSAASWLSKSSKNTVGMLPTAWCLNVQIYAYKSQS